MPVLCYHPDKHSTATCSHLASIGKITEYSVKGSLWFFGWAEHCVPESSFSSLITSSKITTKVNILFSVPVYFIIFFFKNCLLYLFLFFIAKAQCVSSFLSEKKFPPPEGITDAIKLLLSLVILKSCSNSDFDQ